MTTTSWPAVEAIVEAPPWLLEHIATPTDPPRKTAGPSVPHPMPAPGGVTAYGSAALARQIAAVATAPEGQRNHTLNTAAFSLGQLIPGGHLPEDLVRSQLAAAAVSAGLGTLEADRTINSGITSGIADPYTPTPTFTPLGPAPDVTFQPKRLHADDLDPASQLELITLGDLLADPPEQPPELIEGLLREGDLVVIAAPRAVGKSWLAMQIGLLLAAGQGQLFGTLPVLKRSKVLFCHGEVDDHEALRRYRLLITAPHCPDLSDAPLLNTFDQWRITLTTKRVQRSQPDGTSVATTHVEALLDGRLEHDIVTDDIEVLIIDPWAVYYAGAENSNDEVEQALAELRRLQLTYGLTVIVIHHFGKNTEGRDPEDLWRGASRLADWASTRISIVPHYNTKQAEARGMSRADARRYVDVTFLKRSVPLDDLTAERDLDGWFIPWTPPMDDAVDEPVDGGRPSEVRTRWTPHNIAALLDADGGEWPSGSAAAAAMGISRPSADQVLREATNQGVIVTFAGSRGATGYRLAGGQFNDLQRPAENPSAGQDRPADGPPATPAENPHLQVKTAGQPPKPDLQKTPPAENPPAGGPQRSDQHKRENDDLQKTPLPPKGAEGGHAPPWGRDDPPSEPAAGRATAPQHRDETDPNEKTQP